MGAKFYESPDEMSVKDITEVLYTASNFCEYFVPLFQTYFGINAVDYILNIMLENGIIQATDFEHFKKFNVDGIDEFVHYIAQVRRKQLSKPMNINLLVAYLSAIVLRSNKDGMNFWFKLELPAIGAVGIPDNSITTKDMRAKHRDMLRYASTFKHISDKQWEDLKQLSM